MSYTLPNGSILIRQSRPILKYRFSENAYRASILYFEHLIKCANTKKNIFAIAEQNRNSLPVGRLVQFLTYFKKVKVLKYFKNF